MNTRRYVITLVHGTFARGAEWIRENSSFNQQIAGLLSQEVIFRSFEWSGANSHPARLQAGEQLAIQLGKQLKEFPDHGHFIIAHSHGGNVALYAKDDWRVRGRISGLVTLGTPFIGCQPRRVDRLIQALSSVLKIVMILAWIAFASLFVHWAVTFFHPEDDMVAGKGVIALVGCVVLYWFSRQTYSLNGFLNKMKKELDVRLLSWVRRRQQETARRINPRIWNPLSVLSIIVSDDEARRWLAVLRFLSNVIPTLSRPLAWVIPKSVGLCGILLLAMIINGILLISYDGAFAGLLAIVVNSLLVASFVITIVAYGLLCLLLFASIILQMLIRSHRFGFGGESVMDNLFSDIFIAETPIDFVSETFTTVATEVGLHHSSFFTSPKVSKVIAEWINSIAMKSSALSI